jgi:ribose transport system ATP-binding protein
LTTGSSLASVDVAALEVQGLIKTFGMQRALDRVDLRILPGSVHGLLGENGSGKSTLIKILSGFYEPDSGTLALGGNGIPLPLTPTRAAAAGLQFVHQDLGLIPTLTVAENMMLGAISSGGSGALISDRRMRRQTGTVLAAYGVALAPDALVSQLLPVERALLAIVRAINAIESAGADGGVLVLDEPTVFLPREDVERVFALVRRLVATGCSVILVSHDLDEVLEVTDEVTVLRDGKVAGSGITAELSRDDLVHLIVGRAVDLVTRVHASEVDDSLRSEALAVTGLTGYLVNDVSFAFRRGEIVGLTGLAGSGFDQIPYLLTGARRASGGRMVLHKTGGREVTTDIDRLTPLTSLALGLGLLPSDRRNTAGIGTLDLVDNISMLRLHTLRGRFGLSLRKMRLDAAQLVDRFDVRPREVSRAFGTLSGGNQQKALLAKWLAAGPDILLIDEPTQGVDIGARQQIFDQLREAADGGTTIVLSSTDHEQLAALTDRTLIFHRGSIVTEISGEHLTKQALSEASVSAGDDTRTLTSPQELSS